MIRTVPWWRRLLYSFISILVAGTIVGLGASCRESLFHAGEHLNLGAGLVFGFFIIAVGLSGWLIAVPIVLLVRDYTGWRFWAWGATGLCIGPVVVFGACLFWFGFVGSSPYFVLATAVSALSTAAYLLLVLRREQPS
jgi:hypothetical protein